VTATTGERAAPRAPAAVPARCGFGLVLAIALMALNLRTLFASLPPLLPDARADLGLSATASGLLATLPVACLGAFAPLAPRLARRISIERLLVACGALTAAGVGVRGAGGGIGLFAGTVLAGAAIGVAQALIPVLARTRCPQQSGMLTGVFSMALTASAGAAAALSVPVQRLLADSWGASLSAWAIPAALATLVWVPAARRRGTTVAATAGPRLTREPLAWSIVAFFGVQSLGFYAGLTWLPTVLESHGYSSGHAGTLLAVTNLVQVPTALVVPILAARRPRQVGIMAVIVALAVIGILGLLAAPGLATLWLVALGLGQGGTLGLGLILPVLRGGDVASVASLTAMTFCVGYLLAAVGPWLLGAVRDLSGGWSVPLAVLAAITAGELALGLPAARGGTVRAP
jgi:CP family cyanate transporter-like MFS transporter